MTDPLQSLLRQLTIGQRLGIAGAAIVGTLLLVGFVAWAGQPDYQPAFTRLTSGDAGAIAEALRSAKVPFQVADAGSTILVPGSRLGDARVAAAAAGVAPDGSDGFELLDRGGLGVSEFDQRITYQRALAGELSRTIASLDGVAGARVAIVPAEQGLFVGEDRPASASVVLQMRDDGAPSASLVRAVRATIAGAVAGLIPENVTVVDGRGRVLAGPDDTTAVGVVAAQQAIEGELTQKVELLVDQALGPGHASVAVSVLLDTEKVEREVTSYEPVDQQQYTPVSVQRSDEWYSGPAGSGPGGIPGSTSNVPGLPTYTVPSPAPVTSPAPATSPAPGATPAPGTSPGASPVPEASPPQSGYARHEETVNYNLSQTVERIIREPGAVERLSVAVLVDQAAIGALSPEDLQTTIAAAIGADATRGDVVSVRAVQFAAAPAPPPEESDPLQMVDSGLEIARSVAGVLVALLLLFLVWRNLRALRHRAEELALLGPGSGAALSEPAYAALGQGGATLPSVSLPPPARPRNQVQERLRHVADDQPEALVGLMSGWLREDQKRA